jgi:hypothetical protein
LAGRSLGRAAVVLLVALSLAACGPMPEPAAPTADTGEPIRPAASPDAGEVPELTNQATATIVDGRLEPNVFAGPIGTAFQLMVTGDGTEHTLAIEELVDDFPIAAEGETAIGFTIVGEPGILQITLDGEPAGEFERQSPSGVISE